MFNRYQDADVTGRRVHGAEKGYREEKTDVLESREGNTGCDHQDRAGDQQTTKIVTRREKADGERQNSGPEQSRRGHQSDLRGIESDLCQIDRKHDGGKAIAKAAQCPRTIEKQEAGTWIQGIAFLFMIAL